MLGLFLPSNAASLTSVHARELRDRGFTVLSNDVVPPALVERALQASHLSLDEGLACVESLGCEPLEQCYSFNDICHRSHKRWDLAAAREHRLVLETAIIAVKPVIEELHRLPTHPAEPGLPWTRRILPCSPALVETSAP